MREKMLECHFDQIIKDFGSEKSLRTLLREAYNLGRSCGHSEGIMKGYRMGKEDIPEATCDGCRNNDQQQGQSVRPD